MRAKSCFIGVALITCAFVMGAGCGFGDSNAEDARLAPYVGYWRGMSSYETTSNSIVTREEYYSVIEISSAVNSDVVVFIPSFYGEGELNCAIPGTIDADRQLIRIDAVCVFDPQLEIRIRGDSRLQSDNNLRFELELEITEDGVRYDTVRMNTNATRI